MGTSKWNEDIQTNVLQGIESGLTLRQIAEQNGISQSLIIWQANRNEAFANQYTRAMEIRTEADFEGLIDRLDDPERTDKGIDPAWVNWKRLQIDTIKWALSKRNPKKYADRPPDVNINATLGVQLVHAIPRPDKPALNAPEPPIIEAEVS